MRAILMLTAAAAALAQPPGLIFDTDMGNDIDDALALGVIHALESRGEVRLLAVTLTKDHSNAPRYCDIVNTFYGRGSIPVGAVKDGRTPQDSPMISVPVQSGRYRHTHANYPEAVDLIRRTLESQPDGSVIVAQVGFSTNLVRLLESPGGPDLVRRKVKLLSIMAGQFAYRPGETPKPEYNVKIDIPAAQKLFSEWPTPIVASGFEIGRALMYPAKSIERDFRYVEHHPVVDAYRAYQKMPYDRPTWDLTSVLYAVRPDRGYFTESPAGRIVVDAEGHTRHTPGGGTHRYLSLGSGQAEKALEALIQLASQPPGAN